MKRLLPLLIPVGLVLMPVAVLVLSRTNPGLKEFLIEQDGLLPVIFRNVPYAVLLLAALLGWHFNQTRVGFVSLCLCGVYLQISLINDGDESRFLVHAFVLSFICVAFFFFSERRLRSFVGVVKCLLIGIGFIVPLHYDKILEQRHVRSVLEITLSKEMAERFVGVGTLGDLFHRVLFWRMPGCEVPASLVILFLCAGAMIWLKRSPTHRVLAGGFAGSLASAFLGLVAGLLPISVGEVQRSAVTLYFSFSGVLLLYGLYALTWGKAYTDELTGQANRRALEEAIVRLGRRYSIAMVDIDHFKKFNDTYGHQVGDDVLRYVASRLAKARVGRVYRYGGEEFAIVSPHRSAEVVADWLDDLREAIASSSLVIRTSPRNPALRGRAASSRAQRISITVSMGVAERSRTLPNAHAVIEAADKALYAAKKQGRNRVVCHNAQ